MVFTIVKSMGYPTIYSCAILLLLSACETQQDNKHIKDADITASADSNMHNTEIDSVYSRPLQAGAVEDTVEVARQDAITDFAETLIGTPYKYASSNPEIGFDCSGFIFYVFDHFDIEVPRSSADFTQTGKDIPVNTSRRGDVILFTGTDSTEAGIGHVGIITNNTNGAINFIHATSGKQMSVTITPLDDYYKSRFVKVVRVTKAGGS